MARSSSVRPFDCEEDALHAILNGQIYPGDAVIIRYEGPRGGGMRFSGATRYTDGILGLYTRHAACPMHGGYIDPFACPKPNQS